MLGYDPRPYTLGVAPSAPQCVLDCGSMVVIPDKIDYETECNKRQARTLHNDKGTVTSFSSDKWKSEKPWLKFGVVYTL